MQICVTRLRMILVGFVFNLFVLLGVVSTSAATGDELNMIVSAHRPLQSRLSSSDGMPRESFRRGEEVWIEVDRGNETTLFGFLIDAHDEFVLLTPNSKRESRLEGSGRSRRTRLIGEEHWADGMPLGLARLFLFSVPDDDPISGAFGGIGNDGSAVLSQEKAAQLLARLTADDEKRISTRSLARHDVTFLQPETRAKSRGLGVVRSAPAVRIMSANEILRIFAPQSRGVRRSRVDLYVQFAFDSDALSDSARVQLDEVAKALQDSGLIGYRFDIGGHTDSRGLGDYNMELSMRRAESVRGYLIGERGVSNERLTAHGHGAFRRLDPRESPDAHAANRRVEFQLIRP